MTRGVLDVGDGVVLETAGRAGHWHPPLHLLMTSGGVTPAQRWREVDYVPCAVLHKQWPYSLCTRLQERVKTQAMRPLSDARWRQYPRGLVAYLAQGKVPGGGAGLAYSLAKYVVSPPLSLRRLLRYDGQRVRSWSNDHKTGKRQEEAWPVVECVGRMVQHMLPKGWHRMRSYGLHAPWKAKKVRGLRTRVLVALGRAIKGTYRMVVRPCDRERVWASTGRDPLRCGHCGRGMILWKIWHPRYGVVYDALRESTRGRYGPRGVLPGGVGMEGDRPESVVQLQLW